MPSARKIGDEIAMIFEGRLSGAGQQIQSTIPTTNMSINLCMVGRIFNPACNVGDHAEHHMDMTLAFLKETDSEDTSPCLAS